VKAGTKAPGSTASRAGGARGRRAAGAARATSAPEDAATPIAIGLRAKTGWAAAVLLAGPVETPRVLDSRRVELCDPADPDSRQPYHAGVGTFQDDDAEVKRVVRAVRRYAARAMKELLAGHGTARRAPHAGAVVAGSDIDPAKIGNLHLRAHALEGRLYRDAAAEGLAAAGIGCEVMLERDLYQQGARRLGLPEPQLRERVTALGRGVAGGWRAENKAAALAAWIALAGLDRSHRR
jgi:hypothetical protein